MNLTKLPLTGSSKQQCQLTTTTFIYKLSLRTTFLKEQLYFANKTLLLQKCRNENAVRVKRRVMLILDFRYTFLLFFFSSLLCFFNDFIQANKFQHFLIFRAENDL